MKASSREESLNFSTIARRWYLNDSENHDNVGVWLVAQLLAKFDNFSGCLLRTNPIDQVPHSDLYPVQIGTIDGNACGSLGERIGRHGQARLFSMQCSALGSQNATRILPWNHIPHLYVVCLEYINVQALSALK